MEPIGAKIQLSWNNGRCIEIGTLEVTSQDKDTKFATKIRIRRKRLGWEFVRLGMHLMFPERKWESKYE